MHNPYNDNTEAKIYFKRIRELKKADKKISNISAGSMALDTVHAYSIGYNGIIIENKISNGYNTLVNYCSEIPETY